MRLSPLEHEPGSASTDDALTIERAGDLAAVRPEWTRLAERAGNVFGTWEWAEAWCRHFGCGLELAIGVARRGGAGPVAIVPLCVSRQRPVKLLRFVGAGPSDELGPLCAPADRAVAAAALRRHVTEMLGGSGIFVGERLWGEDPLAPQLGAITMHHVASPVLRSAGRSFDEFLASRSRNFRSNVRRRERRLAEGWRLEYRLTEDPARLDADMRTLIALHRARWGAGESSVFTGKGEAFHLEFARQALERGWLRLWTMELDGRPVAAWYGLRYGGIESYYQAGRDPAVDGLSVGFVLLCHSIRSAFEDGMREYRFGSGGEPYKSRFAEADPGLDTVAIAAGARGKAALAAIRVGLLAPKPLQRVAWRLGAGNLRQ
jgi:CelD/BcsL family acetyltransferase involved in cellulose biosynthesis